MRRWPHHIPSDRDGLLHMHNEDYSQMRMGDRGSKAQQICDAAIRDLGGVS